MKILYISCRYYPVSGGSERSLMNLAYSIKDKGAETLVLTQEWKNHPSDVSISNVFEYKDEFDTRVTHIPYLFTGKEVIDVEIDKQIRDFIYKHIKSNSPDIIHGNFLNHLTYIASSVAKELKIPYVQTVCGSDIFLFPKKNTDIYKMAKICLSNSTEIIAKSDDLRKAVISDFLVNSKKIKVISNGVSNLDIFIKQSCGDYVLAVGALRWVKGFDLLAGISILLQKINSDIKIKIIGDGEDRERIENYIYLNNLHNIELLGALPNLETINHVANSKFIVSTSHFEGFSNVILEANALKKTVIAFDTIGVRNSIINNETGILIEYLNLRKYAENIDKLFNNNVLRERLENNAYVRIKDSFSWNDISDKIIKEYKKIK